MIKKHPISKNSLLIAVLGVLSVTPVVLHANTSTNYVGVDAVYSFMGFKTNYGANMFAKRAPGLNAFYGHKFNHIFGAEVGYEAEAKRSRVAVVYVNDYAAGVQVEGVRHEAYITKLYQKHPYVGVSASTAIKENNTLSMLIGGSLSHIRAIYNQYADSAGATDLTRTFAKTKLIPMVRVSAEHHFNDQFGLRALCTWRNTSQFKIKTQENPLADSEVKLKNAINVGLGLTYNW